MPNRKSVFFTARFELNRETGEWVATVNQLPTIVAHGKTLVETHDKLRIAIGQILPEWNFVDIQSSVVFNDVAKYP